MMSNDEFDKKLFNYFKENKQVPKKIEDSILNVNLNRNAKTKKIIDMFSVRKVAIAAISLVTISTGVVFAKDISKFVQNLFKDNQGVQTAVDNGYMHENPEMIYFESSSTKIRMQEMVMDDYTLDINFETEFDENIDVTGIENFRIPNMLVTDENNNILCSWDINTAKKFSEEKGLPSDNQSVLDNSINVASSIFISKTIDKNSIVFTLNCSANDDKFPKSEKLYVRFDTIILENNEKHYNITGDWLIEITVPEKFVNRESTIYEVINCNNQNVKTNSITAEVYETGMNFKMNMYFGDYEYWSNKLEEIRKENVLDSRLIKFENCYVENEVGEKFYPSMTSSNDGTYSFDTKGQLQTNLTFNLTKYDATDNLKVVLHMIDENEIIVNLQSK